MTTYIDPLRTMLEENYPQPNPLWNYSSDNQLAASWLLATPTNVWGLSYSEFKQAVPGSGPLELETCTVESGPTQLCQAMDASMTAPGQTPQKLLIGHSDDIVDAMYDVMISATVLLDITTLSPPTGRYLDSMKNALTYLSNKPKGQRPIVRILVSNPLPNLPPVTVDPFIKDLTSGLDASKGLQVYCFVMSSSFSSWNHAKIVAADGVRAVVGGHNQFSKDYLGLNPVNDVSMRLTGTAARHAQDFANSMWVYGQWYKDKLPQWVQDYNPYIQSYMSAYRPAVTDGPSQVQPGVLPAATMYDTATAGFTAPPSGGSVPVLAVGRGAETKEAYLLPAPDSYKRLFNEPADEAIVLLVSLAKRTVRMSLQSFQLSDGWVAGWNPNLLGAMADALNRGVLINVVTSNPGAVAGGDGDNYSADLPSTVNAEVAETLVDRLGLSKTAADQIVSERLSIATFRYSADATYPGNVPISNHAKTVIVDDSAFYIGSQNMYSCNLNEFGYIVEDAATAQSYVANYWTPLWEWSKGTVTTVVDPDVLTDHQVDAMQFILALPLDAMLNREWTELLDEYNAATTATAKAAIERSMNELITTSGFDTTAATVRAGLQQPFFTETAPSTDATAEALRFVANLMTTPSLMIAFNKVVMTPGLSVADANTAINNFLASNGYSCTVLQVLAAFTAMQTKVQAYWSGTYTVWLTDDGGITYANASNSAQPHAAQPMEAPAATGNPPLPALGPALVVTATGVTFGGAAIVKPIYNDNQLTWSSSDGNATSAVIQFGLVTRGTLNDSFTGLECFGTVTNPGEGGADPKTYSLYGRAQASSANSGSDSGDSPAYTIAYVVGALVLTALIASLGIAVYRSLQRKNERYQTGRDKRDEGPDDGSEEELVQLSSPGRGTEASVVRNRLVRDRSAVSESEIGELSSYLEAMSIADRNNLQSAARELRTLNSEIDDPPAFTADWLSSAGRSLDTIGTNMKKALSSVTSEVSAAARESMETSGKVQTEIGESFDKIGEQEESGKEFTFEDEI
jgi:phosphatidylserine/phosphatidylglycerophosphate/cardiolipin synthase-like enzyme